MTETCPNEVIEDTTRFLDVDSDDIADEKSTSIDIFSTLFNRFRNYLEETVEHLTVFLLLYLLICIFFYVAIVKWRWNLRFKRDVTKAERILIVIAHPDDECMFFGPTVLNFTRRKNCLVYLMCLSTGQNYGMGKIRKKELYNSCRVLGIDEERITIHMHSQLPDDINEKWPTELVSELILQQIEAYNIDTLITFDKHGVSRHLNHCSLYYAAVSLRLDHKLPEYCTIYVLETTNIIRKYWLFLDIPICYLLSDKRYISCCRDRSIVHNAMRQHKSQLVWFRRLYMIFSRYMMINTLQEIDIIDVELDLELDDDD